MTLHSALTGVELHEVKGAAAATKGFTLVANGAGTAAFAALLGNVVMVNVLADFPTPAAGKITLLAGTTYLLGASLNIGTDYLEFGSQTALISLAPIKGIITYTGTTPMMVGVDVSAQVINIVVSCASSNVFDFSETSTGGTKRILVDGFVALSCLKVAIFDKMGTISMDKMSYSSCTSGVAITGAVTNNVNIMTSTFTSTDVAFIGLDVTGATVETINIEGNRYSGGVGSIGIKGDTASANIATNFIANVSNCQFAGVTTPLSGITLDDIRWNFQGNGIVADTMPDALITLTANATVTTLSVGVPTLVAGTWTLIRASQYTTTTGGRATLNSERDVLTPIDVSVVVDPASGTNKSIRAYVALNGAAINDSGIAINLDAGDPKQISVPWQINLSTTDFIEIFIENETDSVDCTVIDATLRIR